jgi:hypothetical protein
VSLVDWCLQISVRVGWFLLGFVPVGIGVSNRLVPTNICKSRLVPTKNYKDKFCGFLPKGFHVNLVFHVLQLIDLICDCFLMVDECLISPLRYKIIIELPVIGQDTIVSSTSLPLSREVLSDYTKLVSKVLKLYTRKRLGQHICNLLICANILEL